MAAVHFFSVGSVGGYSKTKEPRARARPERNAIGCREARHRAALPSYGTCPKFADLLAHVYIVLPERARPPSAPRWERREVAAGIRCRRRCAHASQIRERRKGNTDTGQAEHEHHDIEHGSWRADRMVPIAIQWATNPPTAWTATKAAACDCADGAS